jgi:hypothetical protein
LPGYHVVYLLYPVVREWIDFHVAELETDWELVREGKEIKWIKPLD